MRLEPGMKKGTGVLRLLKSLQESSSLLTSQSTQLIHNCKGKLILLIIIFPCPCSTFCTVCKLMCIFGDPAFKAGCLHLWQAGYSLTDSVQISHLSIAVVAFSIGNIFSSEHRILGLVPLDPCAKLEFHVVRNYGIHSALKGKSNEIFDSQFFSSFEPAWATDQWVIIVSILVSFLPRYSNFYETPRSIILRGVKESLDFLVSYLIGHSKKITFSFFIIRSSLGH